MRIDFTIPQKWNDLTEWQIRMVGHFMFNNRHELTEKEMMRNVLLCILLIPSPSIRNITKMIILFFKIPFSELRHYTDFILAEKEILTRFPSHFKVGRWPFRKKVYGPAARLANVTIAELSYADTFYYKWITEGDESDLHRITAILYRPASEKPTIEDKRMAFSPLNLEYVAAITDPIPFHIKYMVAHAYQGCRQVLINRHPNVFPKKKVSEEEPVQKEVNPKPYMPFSKIIDAMAMDEVQIFGTHQEVERTLAPKFMAVYEESIIRQRALERRHQLK